MLQTSLTGGILSGILLVLGCSIFLGGVNRIEQHFNLTVAHVSANLLSLAATSLLIPTASRLLSQTTDAHLVRQSRGASFVLLAVYAALLLFEFYSHVATYERPVPKAEKLRRPKIERTEAWKDFAPTEVGTASAVKGQGTQEPAVIKAPKDLEEPGPRLATSVMLLYLASTVVLTTFCTKFAVDSIDKLSQDADISKTFIGLILLPILNNDTAPIRHAIKDNLPQTMNFTIGKCLQTALFVTPLMVFVAWGMHLNLTWSFDGFEVVSLFASVLLLNHLIIDGKSSW